MDVIGNWVTRERGKLIVVNDLARRGDRPSEGFDRFRGGINRSGAGRARIKSAGDGQDGRAEDPRRPGAAAGPAERCRVVCYSRMGSNASSRQRARRLPFVSVSRRVRIDPRRRPPLALSFRFFFLALAALIDIRECGAPEERMRAPGIYIHICRGER